MGGSGFDSNCWIFHCFGSDHQSNTHTKRRRESGIRARVISITMVLAWGLPAVGALGMGWIAEFLGLPFTLALGGALTVLLWLWAQRTGKQLAPILEGSLDPEADSRRALNGKSV